MITKLKLCVLPLPQVVLYPTTSLPFLILEPVYTSMIRKVIAEQGYIAVSWAKPQKSWDGKTKYSPRMICTAGKPILVEELPDGSMKLVIEGQFRVKLTQILQNLPYLVFEGYQLDDIEEQIKFPSMMIHRLRGIFHQWLIEVIHDSLEREAFSQNIASVHQLCDHLCLYIIQDIETRQLLLETTSLRERVYLLNGLLRNESPFCEDQLVKDALKNFEHSDIYGRLAN